MTLFAGEVGKTVGVNVAEILSIAEHVRNG